MTAQTGQPEQTEASAPTARAIEPLPPGPTARTLRPILGRPLDPPDVDPPLISASVARWRRVAWLWRWWERFRDGRGTQSAKAIAFYSFFGLISGLALAFAVAASVPQYREFLLEVLTEALPGLVGDDGLDPDQLASVGSTVGIVGSLVLAYSAISIVRAVDDGVRLVYGVQYEPRSFAPKTLRFGAYLLALAALMGLSYVGSSASAGLFRPVLASVGITGAVADRIVLALGLTASVLLNAVVIMIIVSRLGGVQPQRWRWRACLLGGAALEVVKLGSTVFVSLTVANPRYLSFGAPVAMLLLFYAMSVVVLASAAFLATANEPDPVTAARRQQAGRDPGASLRPPPVPAGR